MNDDEQQAILNENEGQEELEEDIDYDKLYGGEDIQVSSEKSPELKASYTSLFGDYLKQGVKGILVGATGAYGDLFELVGLSPRDRESKKAKEEHAKLQDIESGKGTFHDIESLSEDSELPKNFRLPTSQELSELVEDLGGPGEPKNIFGKTGKRQGQIYGQGLAFGQANPVPALVAGVSGQAAEELGGGPLTQAAAEIVSFLATGKAPEKLLSSAKKHIQEKITALRSLGYADEQITLAVNSAYKNSSRTKIASKGAETEKAFADFAEKSDELVKGILTKEIPGFEKGSKAVHEMASEAYGQMLKDAGNLTITKPDAFLQASKKVTDQLQNTLGKNPDAQAFIKRLSEAAMDATQFPSAEKFVKFYKELNGMGKWMGRAEKDRLITVVKNGIKDTFKAEGKQGTQLAEKFEKANQGIQKAYKAEEIGEMIQKVSTKEGIDYKKFNKLFDKEENVKLFKDILGEKQTNNLKLIANTGKEIKDFDKAWKTANAFKPGTVADSARATLGMYYIYQGDWEGLAKVAATKAGTVAVRKLAEKSLTDPKFQNLIIRGLHAIKQASPKSMASVNEAMNKYMEEEGLDIELD